MVGRAYTEIVFYEKGRDEIDTDDVVAAIKTGNTHIHGKRAPVTRSAYHYLKASLRKTAWRLKAGVSKVRGTSR